MEKINDKDLINKFEDDCDIRGLTEHTIEGYVSSLRIFIKYLHKRGYTLQTIDRNVLRDFIYDLRNKGIVNKTIRNRFSAYSTFYDYAVYENFIEKNVINDVRKRYLRAYKENNCNNRRKLISIEEMSFFINSILDLRDKTIAVVLAKTGIRTGELASLEVDDIDWNKMSITLKPTPKRSNRVVFFDYECAIILRRWLIKRELMAHPECKSLFVSYVDRNTGIDKRGIYQRFIKWAKQVNLFDCDSKKMEDHFTPHCCRHWFTTYMRKAGMPREFIQELRGDKRRDAIDIYDHIDMEELRKSYLANVPQLGLT